MVSIVGSVPYAMDPIGGGLHKRVWYAALRWWVQWTDESNGDMLSSSTDGITWKTPVIINPNNRSYKSSARYLNGNIHYVCAALDNTGNGTYKKAACNNDGTITVLETQSVPLIGTQYNSYHNVCVDGAGNVFIGYAGAGANTIYTPYFVPYNGSGSWGTIEHVSTVSPCGQVLPVAMPSNQFEYLFDQSNLHIKMSLRLAGIWYDNSRLPAISIRLNTTIGSYEWSSVGDGSAKIYTVYATQTGTGANAVISIWFQMTDVGTQGYPPILVTSGKIAGPLGNLPVCPRVTLDASGQPCVFWVKNGRYIVYAGSTGYGFNLSFGCPTQIQDEGATANVNNLTLPDSVNVVSITGVAWFDATSLNIRFLEVTPVYTKPQTPYAFIDSVSPARASQADTIYFTGHGNSVCVPLSYAWSAGGAFLSNATTFNKYGTSFPVGVNEVMFWTIAGGYSSDPVALDFLVGRYPPTPVIDAWPGFGPFPQGTMLYFEGHGESELNITFGQWWYQNEYGPWGYLAYPPDGWRVQTAALPPGNNYVYFDIEDERGYFNETSVVVQITGAPSKPKPTAVIYYPFDNSVFLVGDDISIYGYGQGGTISAYYWVDSVTNRMVSDVGNMWALWIGALPGIHILRLSVMSNQNVWSDPTAVQLYVVGLPTATITTFPTSPQLPGTMLTFTGTGTAYFAVELGNTIVAYEWSSNITGVISTLATFSTDALVDGTHQISFRVQDSYGLWSTPITMQLVVGVIQPVVPQPIIDSISSSVRVKTWKSERTMRGKP